MRTHSWYRASEIPPGDPTGILSLIDIVLWWLLRQQVPAYMTGAQNPSVTANQVMRHTLYTESALLTQICQIPIDMQCHIIAAQQNDINRSHYWII